MTFSYDDFSLSDATEASGFPDGRNGVPRIFFSASGPLDDEDEDFEDLDDDEDEDDLEDDELDDDLDDDLEDDDDLDEDEDELDVDDED